MMGSANNAPQVWKFGALVEFGIFSLLFIKCVAPLV